MRDEQMPASGKHKIAEPHNGTVKWLSLVLALAALLTAGRTVWPQPASAPAGVTTRPTTRPVGPIRRNVEKAANPHWSAKGCVHCHRMDGEKVAEIKGSEIDGVCMRCHDGQRAAQERHPVGRSFAGKQVVLPGGWDAPGGRLGCVTCHDIRKAGHRTGGRPTENAAFLRDNPPDLITFCGKCHVSAGGNSLHNPHVMLKADGTIDARACSFCHTEDYSSGVPTVRSGQAGLRSDAITLCLGCHTRHIEWFEPGHIGHRVTPGIKARLTQKEQDGAGALPLGPNDTILCSTCHNPHQQGVFPANSLLGRGGLTRNIWSTQAGQPKDLPLRGMGKEVCHACHDK